MTAPPFTVHQLAPGDLALMHALLTTFGEAFDDPRTYGEQRPDDAYLQGTREDVMHFDIPV